MEEICNCKHEKCEGFKVMMEDPYAAEIHEDYTLYLMCGGDAYERAMDI